MVPLPPLNPNVSHYSIISVIVLRVLKLRNRSLMNIDYFGIRISHDKSCLLLSSHEVVDFGVAREVNKLVVVWIEAVEIWSVAVEVLLVAFIVGRICVVNWSAGEVSRSVSIESWLMVVNWLPRPLGFIVITCRSVCVIVRLIISIRLIWINAVVDFVLPTWLSFQKWIGLLLVLERKKGLDQLILEQS